MFFQGQNGQSCTSYVCEKDIKLFVTTTKEQEAKLFRETLSAYLKEDKEYQELQQTLGKQLAEKEAKFAEAFQKHLEILRQLHVNYGREMASASYNEFDHKIHVEHDGRMYVIVKECVVDDLHKPVTLVDPTPKDENDSNAE